MNPVEQPDAVMEACLDMPLRELLERGQRRITRDSRYLGIPTMKWPCDFWVYQELLHELRPDVIIEIGNYQGGSALALAHLCDQLGTGRLLAVDIDQRHVAAAARAHPRITFLQSDGVAAAGEARRFAAGARCVLVIEDSSHTYENTLAVMRAYADLVTPGSYFIVEDGICHHGVEVGPEPGPYEAIVDFLKEDARFAADRSRESFLVTWNPLGYLRRVAGLSAPAPRER
jgi:cephalosporin hydroxylase